MQHPKYDITLSSITRFCRYTISTLVGSAVDMFVLWLLSDFVFHGFYVGEYIISPMISFECATVTNFLMAYFLVWKDRKVATTKAAALQFCGYNLSCVGGFLIKMGILLLLQSIFKWDVLLCNIIALCVAGFYNFAMNETIIFRKKKDIAEK